MLVTSSLLKIRAKVEKKRHECSLRNPAFRSKCRGSTSGPSTERKASQSSTPRKKTEQVGMTASINVGGTSAVAIQALRWAGAARMATKQRGILQEAARSKVVTERTASSPDVSYLAEGNTAYYTEEALEQRLRIRREPGIREEIGKFWRVMDKNKDGNITFDEYLSVNLSLFKVLMKQAGEKFVEKEARASIADDWKGDSKGHDFLNWSRFFDSMFELVDTWADSSSSNGYMMWLASTFDDFMEEYEKVLRKEAKAAKKTAKNAAKEREPPPSKPAKEQSAPKKSPPPQAPKEEVKQAPKAKAKTSSPRPSPPPSPKPPKPSKPQKATQQGSKTRVAKAEKKVAAPKPKPEKKIEEFEEEAATPSSEPDPRAVISSFVEVVDDSSAPSNDLNQDEEDAEEMEPEAVEEVVDEQSDDGLNSNPGEGQVEDFDDGAQSVSSDGMNHESTCDCYKCRARRHMLGEIPDFDILDAVNNGDLSPTISSGTVGVRRKRFKEMLPKEHAPIIRRKHTTINELKVRGDGREDIWLNANGSHKHMFNCSCLTCSAMRTDGLLREAGWCSICFERSPSLRRCTCHRNEAGLAASIAKKPLSQGPWSPRLLSVPHTPRLMTAVYPPPDSGYGTRAGEVFMAPGYGGRPLQLLAKPKQPSVRPGTHVKLGPRTRNMQMNSETSIGTHYEAGSSSVVIKEEQPNVNINAENGDEESAREIESRHAEAFSVHARTVEFVRTLVEEIVRDCVVTKLGAVADDCEDQHSAGTDPCLYDDVFPDPIYMPTTDSSSDSEEDWDNVKYNIVKNLDTFKPPEVSGNRVIGTVKPLDAALSSLSLNLDGVLSSQGWRRPPSNDTSHSSLRRLIHRSRSHLRGPRCLKGPHHCNCALHRAVHKS